MINATSAHNGLTLLRAAAAAPASPEANVVLGSLMRGANAIVSATCFAVGSVLFAWLFLRASSVPRWMAQRGVVASQLLVVLLPVQMLGLLGGAVANLMWMPMLVFELLLAGWLIARGTRVAGRGRALTLP